MEGNTSGLPYWSDEGLTKKNVNNKVVIATISKYEGSVCKIIMIHSGGSPVLFFLDWKFKSSMGTNVKTNNL